METDTGETRIFRPSRLKVIGLAAASAAFIAGGALMTSEDPWGWFVVGFFGLCLAIAVVQMLPGCSYLRIGPEGFTDCAMFRARFFRWYEVGNFEVRRVGHLTMVVFRFTDVYAGPRPMAALSVRMLGADSAVSNTTLGIAAHDLADLMNRYRAQCAPTVAEPAEWGGSRRA